MRATPLLFTCVLCAAGLARAQPSPFDLRWTAPSECPTGAVVGAKIGKLIAGVSPSETVEVVAVVTAIPSGYRLVLQTKRGDVRGERTVDDPSCAALADVAALVVALSIDPTMDPSAPPVASASAASAPSPIAPAASTAPAPIAVAPGPVVDAPTSSRPSPPRPGSPASLIVGAGADVVAGPLPGAAPAAIVTVGAVAAGVRLDVGGRWVSPRRTDLADGAGGSFDLLAVDVSVGPWWTLGAVSLGPAAGIEAGLLRARGYGVARPLTGNATWLAMTGGFSAAFALGHGFALRAELAGLVAISRPDFVIEGLGDVHRPSSLGARGGLRAEFAF